MDLISLCVKANDNRCQHRIFCHVNSLLKATGIIQTQFNLRCHVPNNK